MVMRKGGGATRFSSRISALQVLSDNADAIQYFTSDQTKWTTNKREEYDRILYHNYMVQHLTGPNRCYELYADLLGYAFSNDAVDNCARATRKMMETKGMEKGHNSIPKTRIVFLDPEEHVEDLSDDNSDESTSQFTSFRFAKRPIILVTLALSCNFMKNGKQIAQLVLFGKVNGRTVPDVDESNDSTDVDELDDVTDEDLKAFLDEFDAVMAGRKYAPYQTIFPKSKEAL
ncbi:unnamed protein product [Ambrosiozyma monospora]|uniref:Unnamed protein product n=1 Tax=Ambrosiozyma monospora TaxID=43982 RepID=A0ACB5TVJ4_AMBMO|nr:unnamed protein product [Ambrosiozyma monospora]